MNDPANPQEAAVSLKEASAATGVKYTTLVYGAHHGKFPVLRQGSSGRVFVTRKTLELIRRLYSVAG